MLCINNDSDAIKDPTITGKFLIFQIANCCYRLLENPEVVKCKKTLEFIFHVLGILIKRYSHCLGALLMWMVTGDEEIMTKLLKFTFGVNFCNCSAYSLHKQFLQP